MAGRDRRRRCRGERRRSAAMSRSTPLRRPNATPVGPNQRVTHLFTVFGVDNAFPAMSSATYLTRRQSSLDFPRIPTIGQYECLWPPAIPSHHPHRRDVSRTVHARNNGCCPVRSG